MHKSFLPLLLHRIMQSCFHTGWKAFDGKVSSMAWHRVICSSRTFIPACGSISLNISSTSSCAILRYSFRCIFPPSYLYICVNITSIQPEIWLLWLHVSDINSTLRLIFFCCWISYLSSHFPDIKWAHYSRMSGKTSAQIFQTSY